MKKAIFKTLSCLISYTLAQENSGRVTVDLQPIETSFDKYAALRTNLELKPHSTSI